MPHLPARDDTWSDTIGNLGGLVAHHPSQTILKRRPVKEATLVLVEKAVESKTFTLFQTQRFR